MNISSAILSIYNIGDLSFKDYKELVFSEKKRTSKYRIKHVTTNNGILVQNLRDSSVSMLHCVKRYYSPDSKSPVNKSLPCAEVRDLFNIKSRYDCLDCHKKCCELYINNQLEKVTSK